MGIRLSRLLLPILALLALVALACAPAAQPTAEPAVVAPRETPTAAPVEELATAAEVKPSEEGTYVERAGLTFFVPKGYVAGGVTVPPDPREPKYGGSFTRAIQSDPPNLDPQQTTGSMSYAVTALPYDRLIHYPMGPETDVYGTAVIAGLAESWEISDDMLTYTFHLRQGVKWHNTPPVNGREFTSEDVVFTYNLMAEPGSVIKGRFASVNSVTAPDRYTVVYRMKQVDLSLIDTLSVIPWGYILPKEAKQFNRKLTSIGTGAYVMQGDYEYKVGVNFHRNPDYWLKDAQGNQLPYIESYRHVIIPDASARTAAFRTGKIDSGTSAGTPMEVRALLKSNPNIIIQEHIGVQSNVGVGFRLDKEPWSDVRVRRALSLAIDYDEWSRTVYEIGASPSTMINGYWTGEANTPANYGEWYQGPDVKRAKALLAEAGYPNGFTMTVEYNVYGPEHTNAHELMQAYWKAIGVTSQIKVMDYTFWRVNLDKGTWTDLTGWGFIVPFPSNLDSLVAPLVPGGPANTNMGNLNDPVVTALVEEFKVSYKDNAKRQVLLKQIRRRLIDQVYQIPWQYGHIFGVTQPWVRNFQPTNNAMQSEGNRATITAWIDDAWRVK
ncbi:MAG: ABC transporter substrate-binding protein [Dehalococcoidia bacterium]|nr:ABC transporter substrate-binding protein [Dehalococcoidia bacterium]